MADNKKLGNAKKEKNDEFYTQLSDIENEMKHYKDYFKGKTVFCNCDDPYESNFFKYFAMNFNYLGLKKLIATCYVSSPVMYTQLSLFDDMEQTFSRPVDPNKKPYKVEITEVKDLTGNGAIDLEDIKILLKNEKNVCTILKGDGDFMSDECIELLKEADIVVTNPPFSLFKEYIAQLMEYKKKFIILGNQNAVTYKEFFPLFSNNLVWYGVSVHSGGLDFQIPDDYPTYSKNVFVKDGHHYINLAGIRWFTNLDHPQRHEKLILWKQYTPEEYPKFGNYNAINVKKTSEIPCDYDGIMGVPITFLDKYNPDQFEIVGRDGDLDLSVTYDFYTPPSKELYDKYRKANNTWRVQNAYLVENGEAKTSYKRLFIRRKEQPNEN